MSRVRRTGTKKCGQSSQSLGRQEKQVCAKIVLPIEGPPAKFTNIKQFIKGR